MWKIDLFGIVFTRKGTLSARSASAIAMAHGDVVTVVGYATAADHCWCRAGDGRSGRMGRVR